MSIKTIEQPDLSLVLGYAFIPAAVGFLTFGPGLTDEGFLLRLLLGFVWIVGALVTLWLAGSAFLRSNASKQTKRNLFSVLAGYAIIIVWLCWTYPTQARITSMINRHIPVGSSKQAVKEFLGTKTSYKLREEDDFTVCATLTDGIINFGASGFDLCFSFDEHDKMERFEVFHWRTEE